MNYSKKHKKLQKRAFWKALTMSEITGWNTEYTGGYDPIGEYICSKCKECALVNEEGKCVLTSYCPQCGAKMDVDECEIPDQFP